MTIFIKNWMISCICILDILSFTITEVISPPRILLSTSQVVVPEDYSLKLMCIGKRNIVWLEGSRRIEPLNYNLRFKINSTTTSETVVSTLQIEESRFSDSGYYSCIYNESQIQSQVIQVKVIGSPKVAIESIRELYNAYQLYNITCTVTGYPLANIVWKSYISETVQKEKHFQILQQSQNREVVSEERSGSHQSTLTFNASISVTYQCFVENSLGFHSSVKEVIVSDNVSEFSIVADKTRISPGENVVLRCTVNKYLFSKPLMWKWRNESNGELRSLGGDVIEETQYSIQSTIIIQNIQITQEGSYFCGAQNLRKDTEEFRGEVILVENLSLKITGPHIPENYSDEDKDKPTIHNFFFNNDIEKGGEIILICTGTKTLLWKNYPQKGRDRSNEICYPPSFQCNLIVVNATFEDSGTYECAYQHYRASSTINITVVDPPKIISMTTHNGRKLCIGDPFCNISCVAVGNPLPHIQWQKSSCDGQNKTEFNLPSLSEFAEYTITSKITTLPEVCSIYKCKAKNNLGEDEKEETLQGSDYEEELLILPPSQIAYEGQSLLLKCIANKHSYDKNQEVLWKKDSIILKNNYVYSFSTDETRFSFISELSIKTISKEQDGNFFCFVKYLHLNNTAEVSVLIKVNDSESVHCCLISNLNGSTISVQKGDPLSFVCEATGSLQPNISWFWNRNPVNITNMPWIQLNEDQTKMTIEAQDGLFECRASNIAGTESKNITLIIDTSQSANHKGTKISGIIVSLVVVLGIVGLLFYKWRQKNHCNYRKDNRQTKADTEATERLSTNSL